MQTENTRNHASVFTYSNTYCNFSVVYCLRSNCHLAVKSSFVGMLLYTNSMKPLIRPLSAPARPAIPLSPLAVLLTCQEHSKRLTSGRSISCTTSSAEFNTNNRLKPPYKFRLKSVKHTYRRVCDRPWLSEQPMRAMPVLLLRAVARWTYA